MEFKKIQLNGFKSFADKTNFLIESGLTGIVGPNGCGKSNVVESLKWVMGRNLCKKYAWFRNGRCYFFWYLQIKPSKNIAEVNIEF